MANFLHKCLQVFIRIANFLTLPYNSRIFNGNDRQTFAFRHKKLVESALCKEIGNNNIGITVCILARLLEENIKTRVHHHIAQTDAARHLTCGKRLEVTVQPQITRNLAQRLLGFRHSFLVNRRSNPVCCKDIFQMSCQISLNRFLPLKTFLSVLLHPHHGNLAKRHGIMKGIKLLPAPDIPQQAFIAVISFPAVSQPVYFRLDLLGNSGQKLFPQKGIEGHTFLQGGGEINTTHQRRR